MNSSLSFKLQQKMRKKRISGFRCPFLRHVLKLNGLVRNMITGEK